MPPPREDDLRRIEAALGAALDLIGRFDPGRARARLKGPRNEPVTDLDLEINALLRGMLPRPDEGWLSEETADARDRLDRARVWIVDPLDGTREFVEGIPEWCVSIGLAEGGRAVAGGIAHPATGDRVIGSAETGVLLNGRPARVTGRSSLGGASILASRSEIRKGRWDRLRSGPFSVVPLGSVALKLAFVAAGRYDATWSLEPKHEWDVAGGTALVLAAGGEVRTPDGGSPVFNRERPWLPGLVATTPALLAPALDLLGPP